MKIKKGFKLLTIILAICLIAVYLPNNIIIASAEQTQENELIEEETLCVEPEESETDTGIIGEMTEIPSEEGNTSDIMSSDFVHVKLLDGGTGYVVPNGVYAFENFGNRGLWLDIQEDKCLPGYHMQQYAANGNPAETFDRSCLFKITRRESTDSYIIRSMLNNRLTFYFSGNEVLTKEIPPNDVNVSVYDTFKLEYNPIREYFVIKPYSSSNVVAANNTTSSGSDLIKSTEAESTNRARWFAYQYTGETKSGTRTYFTPGTTNGALIQNNTYSVKVVTWTTEIGKNTPYALVHPDSQGMATGVWDASTYTLTLTAEKAGPFKLRTVIRSDGTETAFRTFYGNYPIVPEIDGEIRFIQNIATGKYIDIEGPSKTEGAFIQQWQFNGKPQSKWLFELQNDGYFAIKSQYSNMYIGVDPTNVEYIRQYDSIENNTLWRLVETSSGNYKLVCKSLEASGYALATQSQTSGDGSNLMMTPYTDDANYRDEWAILDHVFSYTLDNYFDTGYNVRFSDANSSALEKISNYNSVVSEILYNLYGIKTTSNFHSYVSSADECKTSTYGYIAFSNLYVPGNCPHITNNSNDHLTRTQLKSGLQTSNVISAIVWTGHILPNNPVSVSFDSGSVVITPHHTTSSNNNYQNKSADIVHIQSINSFLHEVSHQLGTDDHRCEKKAGEVQCANVNCDICYKGFSSVQPCIMTQRWDVESVALEDLYCDDCRSDIILHIKSHH